MADRLHTARAELVLARPAFEPLAELGLDPDPLAAFTGVFAALRSDLGESATIVIDVLPCTPRRARRARRRLARTARRANSGWDAGQPPQPLPSPRAKSSGWIRVDDLFGPRVGRDRQDPVGLAQRQARVQALRSKLAGPDDLLAVQILLRVRSRAPGRAKAHLQALLSGFDTFSGRNHLRAVGLPIFDVAFVFGSDGWWRRRRFDQRIGSGRFRPPARNLMIAREIAGLLKPPTAKCKAHNVVRSGGVIAPPPPGLPTFDGQPGLLPLGRVAGPDGDRMVGVPLEDTFFEYVCGRSRFGKTELGLVQFIHLARSGHGAFFLDPHADAVEHAKAYLTDEQIRERVIEINLAGPAARQQQIGWNPFAMHGVPAEQAEAKVEAVVDAFASALGWNERNTRALTLTTHAARALVELAQQLPAQDAPTIFQIPTLLANDSWRATVLPYLSEPTRQYFTERFPRLSTEAITPVTNIIDRLRASTPIAGLLGSSTSSYDIRSAMDDGLIVLACPGAGGTVDRLVANFLVYDLLHAAKTRTDLEPGSRRPFAVFLDEVQIYDGASSGNLAALLEQTAKYGLRGYFFNQNPERLTPDTLNALTTNRSHLITTALNARAAALLVREWGGEPTPDTVARLRRYTYLASATLHGETTPPFLLHGVPAFEHHHDAYHAEQVPDLNAAIEQTNHRHPVTETIAKLDRLAETILADLPATRDRGGTRGDDRAGSVSIDVTYTDQDESS